MKGFGFIVAVGACLLLVSGCSSFRTEMGQPLAGRASGFVAGQSRVETVVGKLGPPDSATRLPQGFAFLYEHSIVREFQLGISVNYSILRYVKFIHAWNSLEQDVLLLSFDDHGVLQNANSKQWKEDLGGGNAVQFILTVTSLSDVSKFLRPADAHSWGEELLEPLPVALNSGQSLRTGEHGLRQQRIAPDYAGQHALEMAKPKGEKERRRIKKNYQAQPQPSGG
jgi:hypothetical protein